MRRAVSTTLESLERRIFLSWTGATSGSTNDSSHTYNNTANWAGGVIDDSFSGVTFSANTILYLNAARTTAATGLNLNYSGNFNLTLQSSSTTAQTMTINGGIADGAGATTRTITLGSATNPLNLSFNAANQNVNIGTGDQLTVVNVISSGGLTKNGAGTVLLTGADTFASGTTISAGTLQIGSGGSTNALPAGAVTDNGNLVFNLSGSTTISNVISGSGTLKQSGAGTLVLSAANTFSGATTINSGLLQLGNANAAQNSSVSVGAANGLKFSTGIGSFTLGGLAGSGNLVLSDTGAGAVTLSVGNNGSTNLYSGILSGNGALKIIGGVESLSGADTYSGGTTLTAGQLNLNNATAIGTGALTINGGSIDNTSGASVTLSSNNVQTWGGNFTFVGSNPLNLGTGAVTLSANRTVTTTANTLTEGGVIGGAFSFTKAGTGTLMLLNSSTFSGGTTVSAGVLLVNNATGSGAGSGAVAVSSGGTLGGSGTISGAVTVNSGGTLAPGNGAVTAILSVGTLTLASGSNLNAVLNGNTVGSQYDQVNVNGRANVTGSNLHLSGTRSTHDGTLLSLVNTTGPVTGTFTGLSQASTTTYNGVTYTANYAGGTGNNFVLTANLGISSSAVASSAAPSVFGQSVTFTATITSTSSGTPTGTVTFKDGGTTLGTGTLNGSAVATFATSTLALGSHSITAVYGGDANFTTSTSSTLTQTVNKASTTAAVASSTNPTVFGQSTTFTATVTAAAPGSGTPTGTVTFKDGATTLGTGTLNGSGQTTLSTSGLSVAGHSITVVYAGDSNFNTSTSSALTQTVNQASSSAAVASSVNPTVYGQSTTLTATITAVSPGAGTPTGTVTFKDGATTLGTGTLNGSGQTTLNVSSLGAGGHSITVSYGGDTNFKTSSSSALTQTVNVDSTSAGESASVNPSVAGQSVTITAMITASAPGAGTPTGTVTFKDGAATLGTGSLNGSGQATFSTTSLSVGSHTITSVYGGDANFATSTSSALNDTVNRDASTAAVSSSSSPSAYGQSVTFTATISASAPGGGTPTGTVTFLDGGTTLGTGTLNGSGQTTFNTSSLGAGNHSITVSYGGDSNFNTSASSVLTQSVTQDSTSTAVASSVNPAVFGQAVTFTATISNLSGPGVPTGTVTFKDGTTTIGTGTVNGSGVATLNISTLNALSHSITAVYGGDVNNTGSTSSALTENINAAATTTALGGSPSSLVSGQSLTLTATVSDNAPGAGTPGGTVTFNDGATTLGTGTLNGFGIANFSIGLSAGSHSITAVYSGDANDGTSTSSALPETVSKDATNISLGISASTAVVGQVIALTATITAASPGSGGAIGIVTFMDGSTNIGVATLNQSGIATLGTSLFTLGANSITAIYNGDSNFNTSTSSASSLTVSQAATGTTVTAPTNAPTLGQPITFTATVLAISPGSGFGTGTVTFFDGATNLGTGTLNASAQATLTTSSLSSGAHSITAVYAGDVNYISSTSPALLVYPTNLPFTDSFSRANSTTLGAAWTAQSGGFAISSNQAIASSGGSLVTVGGTSAPDVTVSANIDMSNGGSAGLVARYTSAGMYYARIRKVFYSYYADILQFTASSNTWTTLATNTNLSTGTGAMRFDATGGSLALFLNGQVIVAVQNSSIAGAGCVGLYSDDGGGLFTNFSAVANPFTTVTTSLPFSDNFTRADNAFLGSNWTVKQGDFVLLGNQFHPTTGGSLATINVNAVDVTLSTNIDVSNGGSAGLVARSTASGMYYARVRKVYYSYYADILQYTASSNTWTTLASNTNLSIGAGTLRFDAAGGSLALFLNGQAIVAVQNSSITGAGGAGLYSDDGNGVFSNFSAVANPYSSTAAHLPFSDNFSRADNGFLGSNWTVNQGDFVLSGNHLVATADGSMATANVTAADVSASVSVDTSNGGLVGLVARVTSGGFYYARIRKSYSSYYADLLKYVASSNTWTTLVSNGNLSSGTGTLEFDVAGNSLALIFNSQVMASIQDTSITGAGAVGVYSDYNGGSLGRFSAWSGSSTSANAQLPFSDNFNRPNSAFAGTYWTVQQGGLVVLNNQLVSGASGDTNVSSAILNGVTAADTVVSADINLANTGLRGWGGVASRVTASGAYVARLRRNYFSGYAADLVLVQNGQWTTLDSAIVTNTSGTVRLETIGSLIQMYLNDTLVGTATNTALTTGGVGVYANDAGVTLDNLAASVDAAATPQNASLPFTDNFQRPGSSMLGAYWTNTGGDLAISAQQVTDGVAGVSSATVNGISTNNVMLTASINLIGGDAGGSGIGLDARISGAGRYRAEITGNHGNFTAEILREDGTAWTTLDLRNFVAGSGTLRFELLGSSLNLYLNGVPVSTATDATYATGAVGIMMDGGTVPRSLTLGNYSAVVEPTPPTPQNATLPFSDNFNRSDSSTISSYWTIQQGVMADGQNKLLTLVGTPSMGVLNGVSEPNVSIVGTVDMTLGGSEVGLDARVSGSNAYRGEISYSFGTYYAQIEKEIAGTWTVLDSRPIVWPLVTGRPVGMGTGLLRFDLSGSQLGLYLNNQLVSSTRDSSITAAGTVGVNSNGAVSIDDLSVTRVVPASPQNAALTFDDNFTRADNTLVVGPSWIEQSGDTAVQGNQMVDMLPGSSLLTLAGVSQGDVIVSAQVNVPSGQVIGLVARYGGSGDANYYIGELTATGAAQIWKNVNGTLTQLNTGSAASSAGVLRFEAIGAQLQLFLNDVLVTTANDSSLSAGSVGIWASRTVFTGSGSASLTNFDARAPLTITNSVLAISTAGPSTVNYWSPATAVSNILTGDVNGDGKSDAIGRDPVTGNWLVGLSQGAVGFTTQTWGNWSTGTTWSNIITGDFNGDGLTDIAGRNAVTGMWSVAESTGGSFITTTWGGWTASDTYGQVVAGDFNGDGRSDIAAWDVTAGTWVVGLSNGGSFVTSTWGQGTAGATWTGVVVGDFNGDGRSDIAALNGTTGAWHVELTTGTGFNDSIWANWTAGIAWSSVHAADLNGDGLTDLVAKAPGSTSWEVALSTGTAFVSQGWGTQAANLTNEQVGDFNGDGKADIAGQIIGTNQWRVEQSVSIDFIDQYWLTTSAAINIQGIIAGNVAAQPQAAAKSFSTVYNTIRYQPYNGQMKGPLATQQTGAGNDWDQASLLIQLLNQNNIQAQYVSGVISAPSAQVRNWLGARDTAAAQAILNAAGQQATILNAGQSNEAIQFNHVWISALLPGAGGLQWQSMDPSFKFQYLQAGIQNLSTVVPLNQSGYLAHVTTELPSQYYEDQIASYLAANDPAHSLADVSYSGSIIARQFTTAPSSLPYTVVGTPTTSAAVPQLMQARVRIRLEDVLFGGVWEVPLDYTVSVPSVALQTITITYTKLSNGNFMPELRIGGQVVQASGSQYVVNGDDMRLVIDHYDAGSNTPVRTANYDRNPGIVMAIGLDANQYSDASIIALQSQINAESLAVETGQTTDPSTAFNDGLSLAIMKYLKSANADTNIIDGVYQLANVQAGVGDGIADADPAKIAYHWDLPIPVSAPSADLDIQGSAPDYPMSLTGANGQQADRAAAALLTWMDASDLESYTLESVFNADAISAVKGLQWANDHGIPIFNINTANASQMMPQLTIPYAYKVQVQNYVNQGFTVTVPRDLLTSPLWTGTVLHVENITANSYVEGDLVIGTDITHGGHSWYDINAWLDVIFNRNQGTGGDPVDLAEGGFTRSDTDVAVPNIGIPLNFARYYNSHSATDIGLGAGWTDTYSDTITTLGNGNVLWTNSKGVPFTFVPAGGGTFTNPAGLFGTLSVGGDGYVFRDPQGNTKYFNSVGRPEKLQDLNGNSLNIAYDGQGNLSSVSDAVNSLRRLTFTSSNGHLSSVSDFTERTWTYGYQTAVNPNNSQTVYLLTSRATPSDINTPAQVLTYAYSTIKPLFGLMTSITDSTDGKFIQVAYYPNGKVFAVTDPQNNTEHFFYDQAHSLTNYVSALGQEETSIFNSEGLTIKQIHADQTRVTSIWTNDEMTSQTDEMGRTATWQYDGSGNLTKYVSTAGVETDTQFDPTLNRPIQITQPGGRITHLGYDTHGNATSVTDAASDITTMTYDTRGQLLTLTSPNGNVQNPIGNFTNTYTYNDAGLLLTITTGLPSVTSKAYDTRGELTSVTDAAGRTTTLAYDILGRLTQTVAPDPDGAGPLTSSITNVSYNPALDQITTTDPLGHSFTTTTDGNNRTIRKQNPDGTFITEVYDAVGNLVAMIDARGQTTTFIYDSRNRRIQSLAANGASASVTYNADGQMTSSTDGDGNTTLYTYDAQGHLITVTNALSQTNSYTYDAVGSVVTESDPNGTTTFTRDLLGRITQMRAPGGVITTTDYDANGNIVNQRVYDVSGLGTIPADPRTLSSDRQRATVTVYDVLNRPIEVTDPANNHVFTGYDASGRVTSNTDALGHTTTYTYDNAGRLTYVTAPDPDGAGPLTSPVTQYQFDANNNIIAVTDPNNHVSNYQYDLLNRKTQIIEPSPDGVSPRPVISYGYDVNGNVVSMTDALGNTTASTYDSLNRKIRQTNPDPDGAGPLISPVTSWQYDANGNVTAATDALGQTTNYQFDPLNRLSQTTMPAPSGSGAHPTTTYQYDAPGNLASVTDALGHVTCYMYNGRHQKLTETDPDPDGAGPLTAPVTTWQYDGLGHLSAVIDPLSRTTNYTYDVLGRQLTMVQPSPDGVAPRPTTTFTYDADGNLRTRIDAGGNTSTYIYDNLNRVVAQTDQLTNTSQTTYDSVGNVTNATDKNGQVTRYIYDNLNRLTAEQWLDSGSNVIRTLNWFYDAKGRLTSVSDPTSTTTYAYDNLDRPITITLTLAGVSQAVVLNQTFDADNRRTNLSTSVGGVADLANAYLYDTVGDLTQIKQSANGGDAVGPKLANFTYNFLWQFTGIQRYSDLAGSSLVASTTYGYDQDNRLTSLSHALGAGGSTVLSYALGYDAASQIAGLTTPDGVSTLAYDNTGQLKSATLTSEAYSYDANGNRTSNGTTVGSANELAADNTYTYLYDKNGNLTSQTRKDGSGSITYTWDYRNRLTDVVTKNGSGVTQQSVHYAYGLSNNRLSKTVRDGSGTITLAEYYIYDGSNLLMVLDGSGNIKARYLNGPGTNQVLAEETAITGNGAGSVHWALSDHEGSVRDVLDNTGAVLDHIVYDSFGNTMSQTNSASTMRMGYTGQQHDVETGLYYDHARYYDPATGRFLSTDPMGFAAGDNDLYRYVGNSPVGFTDPLGLSALKGGGGHGRGGGGGGGGSGAGGGGGGGGWPSWLPGLPGLPDWLGGIPGLGGLPGFPSFFPGWTDFSGGGSSSSSTSSSTGPDWVWWNDVTDAIPAAVWDTVSGAATELGHRTADFLNDGLYNATFWEQYAENGFDATNVQGLHFYKGSYSQMGQVLDNGQTTWLAATGSATPIVGNGYNFVTGQDLLTGQTLNGWDRAASGFGLASDVAFAGATAAKWSGFNPELTGTAARTIESQLQTHLDNAVERFNQQGLTDAQMSRVATNPNLEAAFRGERIDTFFKESVAADPNLQNLQITPRFKFGPDVFEPATNKWWDVTTPRQWDAHVTKYTPRFGQGTPLFH